MGRLTDLFVTKVFGGAIKAQVAKEQAAALPLREHTIHSAAPLSIPDVAKDLFAALTKQANEMVIEKSSKQVIASPTGPGSKTSGILPDIDFEVFNQMYEQTSWIRAVVSIISKAVVARGWSVVKTDPNAKEADGEMLRAFFTDCNPNDTLSELLLDGTRDTHVAGNAFLEIVYGADGKPKELWSLDPSTMRVRADEHGNIQGYVQVPRFSFGSLGGNVLFEVKEVLHFKMGTRGSTYYGLSPLASLILPVTVDKFAQIYNRAFFTNGAKIRGAFIMKDATPEQVERNREYLQARAKNLELAQSDLVLEGEIDFKTIGVTQKDMEFLQLREFTRNEILAVYGVPPSKVSIIESGNLGGGTGDSQDKTFNMQTILPFQEMLAGKITKLVIQKGFGVNGWALQFNQPQMDLKTLVELTRSLLDAGLIDEVKARELLGQQLSMVKGLELKKDFLAKGPVTAREAIAGSTSSVILLENQFTRALAAVFRKIKQKIVSAIPSSNLPAASASAKGLVPVTRATKKFHAISFTVKEFPNLKKAIPEIEGLIELIDSGEIEQVIQRFSIEAAKLGLKNTKKQPGLEDVKDFSQEVKDFLRNNSATLASTIADSMGASLRSALIAGLQANETIPQMQRRIEAEMDNFLTVEVKPVLDSVTGEVIRAGHTRVVPSGSASEAIARTVANDAYNSANLDILQQAGFDQAVWLLASDACPICVELAGATAGEKLGKTFAISDASMMLPAHYNCRCTWVTESVREA